MLTFAIASRNREKKLKVCIDSICDQIDGQEGFKVVVCDNASTDGTKELLEEYAARYKFVSDFFGNRFYYFFMPSKLEPID